MPKKSQKPPKKTEQSPSNSRSITEEKVSMGEGFRVLREWKVIVLSFFVGVLAMAVFYTLFDTYRRIEVRDAQREKREEVTIEIQKWQAVVKNHPDYRDGHFQLALLYYELGNKKEAATQLNKVIELDPQYESAYVLEKLLEK